MIDGKYAAIKGIIYTNCDFLVCVEDLMGVSKHNSVIMKRLSLKVISKQINTSVLCKMEIAFENNKS